MNCLFIIYCFILYSHIRIDTLAQILTYSNVRANCNMAVVDTTNGLVVGAVLERLGGYYLFFWNKILRLSIILIIRTPIFMCIYKLQF